MNRPDLYHRGKRLELTKRIGQGGEGEVYRLPGEARKAVKVYTGARDPEREAKVKTMVQVGLAQTSSLVAFPEDIVTSRSGEFAGFIMRLVEGFRPVHELYGPKSRKIHYPKVDYRFLVRAAANTARAVAQVHSSKCVIGDLNHSGILVSHDATVALIDADSFQLHVDGRTYHCLVGVPDFTPPELQGRSLKGIVRTHAHDNFGLGVAIFQLLFMGRHPYAGRQQGSDWTLEQLIAQNQFAYARTRKVNVAPPGVVATLDDLPAEVANAFERTFGQDPQQRPGPAEWIGLLQGLEGRLSRCAASSVHFYPTAAKSCPWCKMERASGAILFLPPLAAAAAATIGVGDFDIEKAWIAIKAVVIPESQNLVPKLPPLAANPSEEAVAAKGAGSSNKLIGAVIVLTAVVLFAAYPRGYILWILILLFGLGRFKQTPVDPKPWQAKYTEVNTRWDEALTRWQAALGINQLRTLKADLERAVTEYRGLSAAKTQAVARLQTERQSRQLNEFLDRYLIRRASISGIGPAKTTTLASFGIESAADVTRGAVMAVPGFGPVTTEKLLRWRASYERRFIYNPAPQPADIQAQTRIENEFAAKAAALAKRISGGQVEIAHLANTVQTRLSTQDNGLHAIAAHRAQLDADLEFLGITKPALQRRAAAPATPQYRYSQPQAPQPQPVYQQPRAPAQPAGVTCPSCGAPMVRRTARRGYRRGKQFWGCSRYPTCRGKRP